MMLLTRAGDASRDRIHGSLAGILCGLLAIATHGFDGMLPHSSALVLLVSGVVGATVGSPSGRTPGALFGMRCSDPTGSIPHSLLLLYRPHFLVRGGIIRRSHGMTIAFRDRMCRMIRTVHRTECGD
jgi:hypothetical protein